MDNQKVKKVNLRKYIGNFLIAASLLILLFIYYPIIKLHFLPAPQEILAVDTSTYISIPKIKALAPIIKEVDPWQKEEYLKALGLGVAHAKSTSIPGVGKTTFLFAHSSDLPWRLTRSNTAFLRLGELQIGDEIIIFWDGKEYKYKITDKKEVWPQEVGYLTNLEEDQLVLQTCTPIGTDLKRLLIFAKPI